MILVADNLQITNLSIAQALKTMDPEPVQEMVKKCEAAGAEAIDINSGPLYREPEKKMSFIVEAVQSVSNLPIILDTANPDALEAGLAASRNTVIINGFSLEPAKIQRILPLASRYDADIIGYLLTPNGHVPVDGPSRLNIACELYAVFEKVGAEKSRLIIDPVLVPITWENGSRQAMEILDVIKILPDLLDFPVKTIVGLSNLTTGRGSMEKKLLLERAYLPMLEVSGLKMILMNIFHHDTVKTAKAVKILTENKIFTLA